MTSGNDEIIGDGNMPTALTDLRDIGRYMALIINDERTLNKKILAYNLVSTQNQIYSLMEEISEEKVDRNYVCFALNFRSRNLRMLIFYHLHRSLKRLSAAVSSQPGKPAKPTPSIRSSSSRGISPNTNTHGAFAATTTPSTPGTSATI